MSPLYCKEIDMQYQDYLDEMEEKAKLYMYDEHDSFDTFDDIFDEMEMHLTGNANGSYTFSSRKAAQNLDGVMFDERVREGLIELGFDCMPLSKGPEACDVIVRILAIQDIRGILLNYWDTMMEEEDDE